MGPLPSRAETIRAHRAAGGQVAAVLPVHSPRALLRAFGLLPVEVWGPPGVDQAPADAYLQSTTCSVVRSALAFLLAGGLDAADVLVVPHACDSLQGLGSILLDQVRPRQPVLPFYLPRARGEVAELFLASELEELAARLEGVLGRRPDGSALLAAVRSEEAADALLAELHTRRLTLGLGERDLYRLLRSREYLPAEAFAALARRALAVEREPRRGIPIVVSGIVPEPMALLDTIEAAGGVVVADDLACCGRRLYPPGRSEEPYRRMAESLLGGAPDSTRGSSVAARAAHLLALASATGARAVLFWGVKLCEPELFYLPQLQAALETAGLRSLVVEVDLGDRLAAGAVTRVEALLEMLA